MEILPKTLPDTPKRKSIEVLGCRLSYLEAGQGEPVILLHGAMDTADAFRLLLAKLSQHRRVLAFDLPGCGESSIPPDERYGLAATARYLTKALDKLGIVRTAFCGHERGSAIGGFLALLDPMRVRVLCLLSSSFQDRVMFPLGFRLGDFAPIRWLAPYLLRPRTLRVSLKERYDLTPPYFHDRLKRLSDHLDPLHIRAQLAMRSQRDPQEIGSLLEQLPELEVPTLIIHGEHDKHVSSEDARYLSRQISTSHLHIIERCGHSPHEETPDEVSRNILDWLARWGA